MKSFIVLLVVAALVCSAYANGSKKKSAGKSGEKCGSKSKEKGTCKACYNDCYLFRNTNQGTTNVFTISMIEGFIVSNHVEDKAENIPAIPSSKCTAETKCTAADGVCEEVIVGYKFATEIATSLVIFRCATCPKYPTVAYRTIGPYSTLTDGKQNATFVCSSCNVRASVGLLLVGVFLAIKRFF